MSVICPNHLNDRGKGKARIKQSSAPLPQNLGYSPDWRDSMLHLSMERSVLEPIFPDPSREDYVVSPPADCESHLDGPLVLSLLTDELRRRLQWAVRAVEISSS